MSDDIEEMKAILKEAIEEIQYLETERLNKSTASEISGRVARLLSKADRYLNNENTLRGVIYEKMET